ncbi:hypothetical protein ZIOFF_062743 [Zingiber officinale]|uniref:Uncharacterized protein n=1 Tax=Zingiber officinale TaxID=94328 RepID=A0A8J5F2F6_ZINOF|nr:hypothetical protein ZIOFF_062743 [Zingiber officinale]
MGLGQLPTTSKVKLGIAEVTLVPIHVVAGVLILVLYYLIFRICTLFSPLSRENGQVDYAHMTGWRRAVVVRLSKFCCNEISSSASLGWSHQDWSAAMKVNVGVRKKEYSKKMEKI